jgi:hypothetical protein
MGVSGAHFVAIAGTNQSSLEALLLKRGLRGPGWCLLTGATRKEGTQQVRPPGEVCCAWVLLNAPMMWLALGVRVLFAQ